MLKALMARLHFQTGSAPAEPPQYQTAARSPEIPAIAETKTSTEDPAANPPAPAASRPRWPSVLASYAPLDLGDKTLAIREVRQTGTITWVLGRQGWCINPSTSFPLTVVGADEGTARQIREALDGLVDHYSEDVTEVVA